MKKERFKEIVRSYSSTTEEIQSLQKLAVDYPFSQIVHLLLANASKKDDQAYFQKSLVNAALHSTDRSILKSLIENNLVPSELIDKNPIPINNNLTTVKKTQLIKKAQSNEAIDSELLREEVLKNLELLIQTKKEASVWFNDAPPAKATKKKTPKKNPTKAKEAKAKKKPSTTSTSKTKKQANIIDEFIEKKPTITKNSKPVNEKEDLSKQSAQMREDVVSESLAKIFANQGKTEKAIEIYKKLIWKLPQKKALFAAQIEKLKKK